MKPIIEVTAAERRAFVAGFCAGSASQAWSQTFGGRLRTDAELRNAIALMLNDDAKFETVYQQTVDGPFHDMWSQDGAS